MEYYGIRAHGLGFMVILFAKNDEGDYYEKANVQFFKDYDSAARFTNKMNGAM